jgi:predicted double-glycine peptidase
VLAIIAVVGATSVAVIQTSARKSLPHADLQYTPQGYGGYVPKSAVTASGSKPSAKSPTVGIWDAYNAGDFLGAEKQAKVVVSSPVPVRVKADALSVLAYSAARRHDLKLARARFQAEATAAETLPDKGSQTIKYGDPQPTLTEDAVYQHAVCTGALGDKAGAEQEYLQFIQHHADSPLVNSALMRIGRFHGGDVPPADMKIYNAAMQAQKHLDEETARNKSVCGPECLAELLKERGSTAPPVVQLALDMGTDGRGTTLEAMVSSAQKHGIDCEGVSIDKTLLASEKLPLIALISLAGPNAGNQSGHYVIVEKVDTDKVTVWDPDANGVGKSAVRTFDLADWSHAWHGIAIRIK